MELIHNISSKSNCSKINTLHKMVGLQRILYYIILLTRKTIGVRIDVGTFVLNLPA